MCEKKLMPAEMFTNELLGKAVLSRLPHLRLRSKALRGPAVAGDCLTALLTSALISTRNLMPVGQTVFCQSTLAALAAYSYTVKVQLRCETHAL